jgi:hypothetical protein
MAEKMEMELVSIKDWAITKAADAAQIMGMNLGGMELSASDLPRLKFPKSPIWTIPSAKGDNNTPTLTGAILYIRATRVFFTEKYSPKNPTAPACWSNDSINGMGKPGGLCKKCPMAKFGSAAQMGLADEGSNGQACTQRLMIAFLTQDSRLPYILSLPPTSLKPMKQFLLGLDKPFWEYQFQLGLEPKQNNFGDYVVVRPMPVKELDPESIERVKASALEYKALLEGIDISEEAEKGFDGDGSEALGEIEEAQFGPETSD